ncbi:MAG: hypothetical protein PVG93_01560 [Phycisphaerales bacterium]|jgi:hypothetical protein
MKRWFTRILAVAQIGGGFFGIMLVIQQFTANNQNIMSTIINLAFAAIFAIGIIAGVALLEDYKAGISLSRFYQIIQIPLFSSPFLQYGLASGLFGTIRFGANSFNWDFAMGSRYTFFINGNASWTFGLNLAALFFFAYLLTLKTGRQIKVKLPPQQLHNEHIIDSPVRQSRKNEFLYTGASELR